MTTASNRLYFGDNLDILRERVADESVDLIYLDPPFNSNATYNLLFREKSGAQSATQIMAFDDIWQWGLESESAYHDVVTNGSKALADLLQAMRSFLGPNDMMAYLTMMAQRMAELQRVLKPSGSIYLHCDPTASHYLKLLMDAIFGRANFRNEIVWHYGKWSNVAGYFQRNHDIILFYVKSDRAKFNKQYSLSPDKKRKLEIGYQVNRPGGRKQLIVYDRKKASKKIKEGDYDKIVYRDNENPGMPMHDTWHDINIINSQAKERLGYPTQKPEALLERIINASSNEGDVVLDPFCGCGTAIAAAERLNRRWMGIDVTHLAITLIRHRLHDSFGEDLKPYHMLGDPKDLLSAESLALHDRYQFEWWALGLVDAKPAQDKRKGADSGIDGYINFFDDNSGKAKRIIVQVKSGNVQRGQIATLKGDMEREKAEIGLFVTLKPPTGPMRTEAAAAGFYEPSHFLGHTFPRVQILTIEELLSGAQAHYPRFAPQATFRQAPRRLRQQREQTRMIWELYT